MDMVIILFGFFSFVVIVFIAFAYFFPEWVGITGKKALEIQSHQMGDKNTSDDHANKDSDTTKT